MRWIIRRVHVLHGRDGYQLVVTDSARWALAISIACDRLMDVLYQGAWALTRAFTESHPLGAVQRR